MLLQHNGLTARPLLSQCWHHAHHRTRQAHRKCCLDRRTFIVHSVPPVSSERRVRGKHELSRQLHIDSWPGRRSYSTQDGSKPREIAVLGGGVTGLATAYFLAETFPKINVTIFESKDTLGGWIRSKPIDVGDGEIIFEQGPRSLRPAPPNGTLALRMIQDLDLVDDLLITPRSSPAAQNRFVYYPDHLVRMPGPGESIIENIRTVLFEPVFKKFFRGILNDARTDPRGDELLDESVGDFVARRFDKNIAENLVSALFHGIYAGDIWRLSAKSILALPWAREAKYGDLVSAMYDQMVGRRSWNFCDEVEMQMTLQSEDWDPKIQAGMVNCSVFTFKKGIGQLVEALEQRLKAKTNIKLMRSTDITAIEKGKTADVEISHTGSDGPHAYSHLISTISPKHLLPLLKTTASNSNVLQRTIGATTAVTVMVINLYYRTPDLLNKVSPPGGLPRTSNGLRGFGYLIPSSVPFVQNPERALGVIFDSDISPDLWSTVPEEKRGTKVTVMMGGHWWDEWSSYPDADEAKDMAMSVLARHLGVLEEPVAVNATLQKDCIPQYHVGHSQRMAGGHTALLDAFDGRVRVAGSWYTGVGVNDCLRGAFDVVKGLAQDLSSEKMEAAGIGGAIKAGSQRHDTNISRGERTGLEGFKHGRPMALVRRQTQGEVEIVEVDREGSRQGYFSGVRVSGTKGEAEE